MKTIGVSALLVSAILAATTSAASLPAACTETCNRWGQTKDCGADCPPCRTLAPSGGNKYNCWAYEAGTGQCPKWNNIIDCGKTQAADPAPSVAVNDASQPSYPTTAAPEVTASPSPSVRAFEAAVPNGAQEGVTIYNNCGGDYVVMFDNRPVREGCLNGNYCNDFVDKNPAFYVRKPSDHIDLGRTLVELFIPRNQRVWYDISKIAGFNVGAEIKYAKGSEQRHTITCSDVNCRDAYWLCDIAVTNKFSPVYDGPAGGGFAITFCPSNQNSAPETNAALERAQGNPNALPFTCRVKLFSDRVQLPGTIVDGGAI